VKVDVYVTPDIKTFRSGWLHFWRGFNASSFRGVLGFMAGYLVYALFCDLLTAIASLIWRSM
jgi:hypothetical protein